MTGHQRRGDCYLATNGDRDLAMTPCVEHPRRSRQGCESTALQRTDQVSDRRRRRLLLPAPIRIGVRSAVDTRCRRSARNRHIEIVKATLLGAI